MTFCIRYTVEIDGDADPSDVLDAAHDAAFEVLRSVLGRTGGSCQAMSGRVRDGETTVVALGSAPSVPLRRALARSGCSHPEPHGHWCCGGAS